MNKFIYKKCPTDNDGVNISNNTNLKKIRKISRLYMDNYLSFGSSWTGDKGEPISLYVVCDEKFSNNFQKTKLSVTLIA